MPQENPCDFFFGYDLEWLAIDNADPYSPDYIHVKDDDKDKKDNWNSISGGSTLLVSACATGRYANIYDTKLSCRIWADTTGQGDWVIKKTFGYEWNTIDTGNPRFHDEPQVMTGPDAAQFLEDASLQNGAIPGPFFNIILDHCRSNPCRYYMVASAEDTPQGAGIRNMNCHYGQFTLEPLPIEPPPSQPTASANFGWVLVIDKVPLANQEFTTDWCCPPEDPRYETDGDWATELTYYLQDVTKYFLDPGCTGLQLMIQDNYSDPITGYCNWHRSADVSTQIQNNWQILDLKAYQTFNGNHVEATYEKGPSFARDGSGVSIIDFALAVEWVGLPPNAIPVHATNKEVLPPHIDGTCDFYVYRLAVPSTSPPYIKLYELFFNQPPPQPMIQCIDFYLRGHSLEYNGQPIHAPKFRVSDNCTTWDQLDEAAYLITPSLFVSHRDHLLYADQRDDDSYSQACDSTNNGERLKFGRRRGEYYPGGDMIDVYDDLRLGGTGKVLLTHDQGGNGAEISVESEGDLFVVDSHGAVFANNVPGPWISRFHARGPNGEISIPAGGCGFTYRVDSLTDFSVTDWLILTACDCLNKRNENFAPYDFRSHLRSTLLETQSLKCIGGYYDQANAGLYKDMAPDFNEIIATDPVQYQSHFWLNTPTGGRFIAAWMECHCKGANASGNNQYAHARAIDLNNNYGIKVRASWSNNHLDPECVIVY